MGIIDRLRGNDDYPFEVGDIYYNEDADLYFRIDALEPYMEVTAENSNRTRIVDKDVYRWKYENGVIREPDDDVRIIDHSEELE